MDKCIETAGMLKNTTVRYFREKAGFVFILFFLGEALFYDI